MHFEPCNGIGSDDAQGKPSETGGVPQGEAERKLAGCPRRSRAETGGLPQAKQSETGRLPQVTLRGNEMEQNKGEKNEEELDG